MNFNKYNLYTFFKSRVPVEICDLLAVRLNDGTDRYYIKRYRYGTVEKYVSRDEFIDMLAQCAVPIVLDDSYMEEGFDKE